MITKKVVVGSLLAFFMIPCCLGGLTGGNNNKSNDTNNKEMKQVENSLSPEQIAEQERKREEQREKAQKIANQELGLEWDYSTFEDDMGQGTVKIAGVKSLNTLNFDFPYRGEQRATLILREHPRHGTDVIVKIERGQFVCASYTGCKVDVVFGSGSVKKFRASEPEGYSTTKIFINDSNRFISQLKKVDKVRINVTFYQEGNQTLEFKVDNLDW